MAAAAPLVAAIVLVLFIAPGIPANGFATPTTLDTQAHLTPPNPAVHTWPAGFVQGAPLPPAPRVQVEGSLRAVVLLVEFVDVAHDPLHEGAYFEETFNDRGAQSFRAYYEEVSFGRLTINSTIIPTWWRSSRTMAFYGQDAASGVDNSNGPIYALVVEAVRAADPSVDFSAFDTDSDGVVDHLFVVHAGLGQEDNNATDLIWSHRWAVSDADLVAPGSQPLSADGVQIYGYIMVSEASPVGVVTHEFGHDLGLPDLYDADESSEGAGRWELMAGGTWNGFPAGSSPAHLSAWSRAQLGWIAPVTATGILEGVRIEAIETTGLAYLLPVRSGFQSEYFLVENRQPIGFDAALPGSGLLIWHVDEAMTTNDGDIHRLLDLEEADERISGDHPLDPGDAWESTGVGFGPETFPSSRAYNGEATAWRVRSISASGHTMTATIAHDVDRDLAIHEIKRDRYVTSGPFTASYADVVVSNEGQGPELVNLRLRVYFENVTPERLVAEQVYDRYSVPAQTSLEFRVGFDTPVPGRYLIHAVVTLEGDQIPSNNERLAHVLANRYYYIDNVEYGPNGWSLDGTSEDLHRWRIVDNLSEDGSFYSPTQAWRFGYVPTSTPNPSPPVWHTLTSRPIVFVPANTSCPPEGCVVHLIFYHRYDLWGRVEPFPLNASETDHAYVEVRFQRATWTPWSPVAQFVGRDLAWRGVSVNLTVDARGSTTFQVRFNVSSEVMPKDGGWWVDDILVASLGLSHRVTLIGPASEVPAPAGASAAFDLKVVNTGELDESVTLDASLPQGWEARVLTNGGNTTSLQGFVLRLAPDQSLTLRVVVSVPGDAVVGSQASLAASAAPDEAPDARAWATIRVLVEPAPGSLAGWTLVIVAVLAAAALLVAIAIVLWRRRSRPR